jgi:lysophospholipid acyltransferase (LPLAT)-like uncharacterized protein
MSHKPTVTGYEVRPATYPEGHWMNRFWGPIVRGTIAVAVRVPFYRYVLRAGPAAQALLATGRPVVFACLHQDMLDCFNGLPRTMKGRKLATMASYSRDGNLSTMCLQALGYEVVRGSSSHGGGEALLMLQGLFEAGASVVLACDGPRAPLGDVKPGTIHLAARLGAPILPVRGWGLQRLSARRAWSKATISAPFLPVVLCVGEPIDVARPLGDPRPYQLRLATALWDLAAWASQWANGPRRAPFTVAAE